MICLAYGAYYTHTAAQMFVLFSYAWTKQCSHVVLKTTPPENDVFSRSSAIVLALLSPFNFLY